MGDPNTGRIYEREEGSPLEPGHVPLTAERAAELKQLSTEERIAELRREVERQQADAQQPLRVYRISDRVREQIENNFVYHSPNEEQARRYGYLRSQLRALAWEIAERTPPSREQAVALTKLEEVGFWMNAAIARGEGMPPEPQPAVPAGPTGESPAAVSASGN